MALEETSLSALDVRSLPSLFAQARGLDARGRNEEARQAYVEILRADPMHFDALTSLAALALKTGRRSAARAAFERAVVAHPHRALGHANLGILLSDEGDLARAREHFESALCIEPANRTAHRGLAILLLRLGETDAARRHGRSGFQGSADLWPYRGTGAPVSLLLILSAIGPNAPIELFMDDRVFQKWTLSPEFFDPNAALPPHDVVFHGIGDADADPSGAALDAVAAMLPRTTARVLNPPERVRRTGRAANAERLARLPGVVTARTQAWSRELLASPEGPAALTQAGFTWPLLLRVPGFHAGEHFAKVDRPDDLARALAELPGDTLLVIQFLDTRGADGQFRKCRVMMVDGRLYPLHLAVSASWKVHYFSADMDRAEHRAEDEAFLTDMPRVLGPRAMQALEAVRDDLGLDYGGIDFALDGDGNVVVFEANAAMAVVPPLAGDIWRYRVGPVDRVRQAVRAMLLGAADASGRRARSRDGAA